MNVKQWLEELRAIKKKMDERRDKDEADAYRDRFPEPVRDHSLPMMDFTANHDLARTEDDLLLWGEKQ